MKILHSFVILVFLATIPTYTQGTAIPPYILDHGIDNHYRQSSWRTPFHFVPTFPRLTGAPGPSTTFMGTLISPTMESELESVLAENRPKTPGAPSAFCHRNWLSYEDKCYRIITIEKEFFTADLFCTITGTSLVSISSDGVLEFLASKTLKYKGHLFWVGLENTDKWKDGTSTINQSWVPSHGSTGCSAFDESSVRVNYESCDIELGFICESNKTLFDPIEQCKQGVSEHSFIGEVSGRCAYRLPITTKRDRVENACADTGGSFMDIDDVMKDGLNAFHEHKVMTNDGLKYWTYLTWNGSHILWKSGEVLQQNFKFYQRGSGSCVTVAFNFTDILETHLIQTDCNDQAHIICSAIPSFTTTTPEVTTVNRNLVCPSGHNWKSSDKTNACYWETSYETNRLSWDDARSYCQGFGGDLGSFHSMEEEKIGLSFQYGTLSHPYWIGLRLDPTTETYKWSDGSPLDYENWAPNHPDHKDKRLRCVAMDAKSKHWISSLCGIVSWFVCKSPKRAEQFVPVIPTRPPLTTCGDDHGGNLLVPIYYFQGYCYYIVTKRYSWHRSKQHCENNGANLVSLHSDAEIGFLLRMLYDDKDTFGNRVWIGLNSLSGGTFRWSDYSPVDFTYWNENEPNNYQNQEKCTNMYIGNGFWNDDNCNSEMNFICKRYNNATETPEIPTTIDPLLGNCKKGWLPHHDRCYLPRGSVEKDRANWTTASEYCTKQGGYITSVRNAKEQAFLTYLMQTLKSHTWIGFHDTIESGKYYWVDNSDIQYTNWDVGEPSFFGVEEDCVKMSYTAVNTGAWEDDDCEKELAFICQMERDPKLPKQPFNDANQCIHPQGWLRLGVLCFKMFGGNAMTWKEAETACRRDGAELISLSGTHIMAVANYLGTEVNQTYWIGLKSSEENKVTLLNNWPITVTKWGKNEPKSYDKNMCYASTFDGYWERYPCDEEMPYICQITTGKSPPLKRYRGDCPAVSEGWITTDGSYCLLPTKVRKDWYQAFLYCFTYGSYLVSIHSFEDLKNLKAAFDFEVRSVFLGLAKNSKGGFMWTDGSPVDFVNWEVGEPVEEGDERCVEMSMETLKWRIISCSIARNFACSTKKAQEEEFIPENAKLSSDTSSGLSTSAITGIFVVVLLFLGIVVGVYFARNKWGSSRFIIPFRLHQSVSFDNALYNVDSTSIEFHDSRPDLEESR